MNIITNNQPRPSVSFMDLPEKVQAEFGYIEHHERWDTRFVQYKGAWYDVEESTRIPHTDPLFQKWDGIVTETFFSGVLFKFIDDSGVIVGRFYC